MPNITDQRQARAIQKLPFCYLCSKQFEQDDSTTLDHVPPRACIKDIDRNFPLQLPTHLKCNNGRKLTDETIGQLVSLIHSGKAEDNINRLKISKVEQSEGKENLGLLTNVNVHAEIQRWIRGFHAALYQQPLSFQAKFAINPPFPVADLSNLNNIHPIKKQNLKFIELIKLNRLARSIDSVVCNNNKVRYECVWEKADNGQPFCIFALDLYNWKDLGDGKNFHARGCVGAYCVPLESMPVHATAATKIYASIANLDFLDPFGD